MRERERETGSRLLLGPCLCRREPGGLGKKPGKFTLVERDRVGRILWRNGWREKERERVRENEGRCECERERETEEERGGEKNREVCGV